MAASRGPALRAGVTVIEQVYRGETSYLAKDPATRKYFRFQPAEAAVMRSFTGSRTVEEIATALAASGLAISTGAITAFARILSSLGLLERSFAEQTSLQLERLRSQRQLRRPLFRGEAMRMRWSVGDADGFFSRVTPHFRWCFTTPFVVASFALFLLYFAMITSQWREFSTAVTATFSPGVIGLDGVLLLVVMFLGLTLLHELAHGVACKYYGGEVHELGFMLLYLIPAFYCNVNDAWGFPDRRGRLWVTASGAWFELLLTCVASIVWLVAAPGTFISDVALAAVMIGGFSAVFANANPLLPLDGYFALVDYLEMPNLRQRASAYLTWWLRRHLLRLDMPEPESGVRERRILLAYGALSTLYIGFILSWVALVVLSGAQRAVGMLGGALVVLAILALLRTKLVTLWRGAVLAVRARSGGSRWRRWQKLAPRFALAALVLMAVIPWDLKTEGPFTVTAARVQGVTAPDSAVVTEIYAREGSVVDAGTPVARILDVDLMRGVMEHTRVADSLAVVTTVARASRMAGRDAQLAAEHGAARAALSADEGRVAQATIRARIGGTMVTPHPERQVGRRVGPGDTLLVIQDLSQLEARARLSSAGSARVTPGQRVRLISYQRLAVPMEATVTSVSAAAGGGDFGSLEVRITLPPDSGLLAGATGEASVLWRQSTILGAIWWAVRSRIRNDLIL
ncbi:MAG TPA: HlyD family efflux transporter periplasmic adaptor subunit [Gemmatimonadales bacterium]|nr:HlyD family efflux transporter periplasmic adaptor subunit [Gemmatimonadales bacterium]